VLAVIAQQPIATFAETLPRAADHFLIIKARCLNAYPDAVPAGKLRDRYLFHRSTSKTRGKSAIVDDPLMPRVQPMMGVEAARREQVSGQLRSFPAAENALVRRSIAMTPPQAHGRQGTGRREAKS
jgi:hypothetical protein